MITRETTLQELQQVPPQHLESVYQLIHALTVQLEGAGAKAVAVTRIMEAAGMLSHWNNIPKAASDAGRNRSNLG